MKFKTGIHGHQRMTYIQACFAVLFLKWSFMRSTHVAHGNSVVIMIKGIYLILDDLVSLAIRILGALLCPFTALLIMRRANRR